MPITVNWYDERQTIVHWVFSDPWTLEDLHDAYDQAQFLAYQVPHWVNGLIEINASTMPRFLYSTMNARGRSEPPNFDMAFIVSKNMLVRTVINMYRRVPGANIPLILVDTVPEALHAIQDHQALLAAHDLHPASQHDYTNEESA